MSYVKPKKHLGQHFLTDKNIAQKIAGILQSDLYDTILEIGPGTGIMTHYLLQESKKNIYVVEIDNESIDYLKKKFPSLKDFIIVGDFLKLDLNNIFSQKQIGIIGNFPYNISTQIVFKLLDNKDMIPEFGGMFQKEVAERITAKHGNKTYGILSVLVQNYYDTEYLFTVNEHVFNPPPKVKSGVIRLTRKTEMPDIEYDFLKKLVKTAFNQRRKTLKNSLKSYNLSDNLKQARIFAKRPEQLSPEEFVQLAQIIKNDSARTY
jgi:16S rRNA (adenine1518-N6/adenine1519-N6)-dimethyltransferase